MVTRTLQPLESTSAQPATTNVNRARRIAAFAVTVAAAFATSAAPAAAKATEPTMPATDGPAKAPFKVMPLGDSITYGHGSSSGFPGTGPSQATGYRTRLVTELRAAGLNVDFVGSLQDGPAHTDRDHEGHRGWRIDQIAAHIDGWLTRYRPDAILLNIGVNDLALRFDVPNAPARLSALIDQIRKDLPTADIFVQKLVPGHIEPYVSLINAYNAKIPAIVAGKDSKVHLVDQSTIPGIGLYDQTHPNDFGYAQMTYNLYQAMKAVYDTAGTWPVVADPKKAATASMGFRVYKSRGVSTAVYYTYTRRLVSGTTYSWQRPAPTRQTYRVRVKGRYETRTRTVVRWVADDPYLTAYRKFFG